MAVVIEELEVIANAELPPSAPSGNAAAGGGELDERALAALLAREAWRVERLQAD